MAANLSLSRRRRIDYHHLLEESDPEYCYRRQPSKSTSDRRQPSKSTSVRRTPSRTGTRAVHHYSGSMTTRSGSYKPAFKARGGSCSYKQEQARKRQIFLRGYNLSFENRRPAGVVGRLKKSMSKVKTTVLSAVAFARFNFFNSCRLACGAAHSNISPICG